VGEANIKPRKILPSERISIEIFFFFTIFVSLFNFKGSITEASKLAEKMGILVLH